MKKIIKLTMALGLIGAASAYADEITAIAGNPLTSNIVVGVGDSWQQSGDWTVTSTGSIDGSDMTGRFRIGVANTGTMTIDGGSVDIRTTDTFLLGNGSASRTGTIDLLSGTLNIDPGIFFIGRDRSTGVVRIQGGVATFGSKPQFDAEGNVGNFGHGSVDFTTANSGTLTVAGADKAYYEGLYAGTDLTFNGLNASDIGGKAFDDQFEVTGSTITAIPEPATLGMVAAFGAGILFIRRRLML